MKRFYLSFAVIALNLLGLGLVFVSILADRLGAGGQSGFGEKQLFLLLVGSVFIAIGIIIGFSSSREWAGRILSGVFVRPVVGLRDNDHRLIGATIWFGILTGIVEGVALWGLRLDNLLAGAFYFLGTSIDIIWVSLIVDVLLFALVGFVLWLLHKSFPKLTLIRLGTFIFIFLMIFDWLAILLVGRISVYALGVLVMGISIRLTGSLVASANAFLNLIQRSLRWVVVLGLLVLMIPVISLAREKYEISRLKPASGDNPNVLLIVIDTLRADHLSVYGYSRNTSPTVDNYASQGVLFENAISTSDWTRPAHASMLTGRFVYEHEADLKPLDDRYTTVSEVFTAAGYRTAAISANIDVFSRTEGFARGFIHFEDHFHTPGDFFVSTVYGRFFEYYILRDLGILDYRLNRRWGDNITRSALDWIGEENQKPFFVMLNYFDIHSPYIPPEPYRSKFSSMENPGGLINTDWDMSHIYVTMSPAQFQGEIDAYDGAISYVDEQIRELLSTLDQRGLLENTIVVFISDHGESFGEHGLLEHHNGLYREMIRVPLIVYWPGHIPAGVRIEQPVSIASLPSTLLELTNVSSGTEIPGPSLTALWDGDGSTTFWPDPLSEANQAVWLPPEHLPSSGSMKAVVNSEWEYIVHDKLGEELYSWSDDVKQETNLAKDPDKEAVLDHFRNFLMSLIPGYGK